MTASACGARRCGPGASGEARPKRGQLIDQVEGEQCQEGQQHEWDGDQDFAIDQAAQVSCRRSGAGAGRRRGHQRQL